MKSHMQKHHFSLFPAGRGWGVGGWFFNFTGALTHPARNITRSFKGEVVGVMRVFGFKAKLWGAGLAGMFWAAKFVCLSHLPASGGIFG